MDNFSKWPPDAFVDVSGEEINFMKENAILRNTKHATKFGMTLYLSHRMVSTTNQVYNCHFETMKDEYFSKEERQELLQEK